MKLLLVLLALLSIAAAPCVGPAAQVGLSEGYFAATVGWNGSVCLVEISANESVIAFEEDTKTPYLVAGFGTDTITIANCYDCDYANIYYNYMFRVYIPSVNKQ